jgi:hypothetical protein
MNKLIIAGLLIGALALAAPLLGNVHRNMACTQGFALTTLFRPCQRQRPKGEGQDCKPRG